MKLKHRIWMVKVENETKGNEIKATVYVTQPTFIHILFIIF